MPPPPDEKQSQAENHQQPDSIYVTTDTAGSKNFARLTRSFFVIVVLIFILLLGNLSLSIFSKREKSSNGELLQYLEQQRKTNDSIVKSNTAIVLSHLQSVQDRERRDSAMLQLQNRLLQSTNNTKTLYEKIPSYANLSKDSLRNTFSDRFK